MLALSRKKNEAIVINNNIEITILEVKGEQVKIGISAPKEVPVYRKEGAMFPMYAQIDLSIAQQNIWLMTESLGLGGVWMGIAPLQERMDAVRKILDLPDNVEAFSLFPLGYPAETRKQQDRFEIDRIHYIR